MFVYLQYSSVCLCMSLLKWVSFCIFGQVWDLSSHLNALAESETEGKDGTSPVLNQAPLANFSGHKDEGYAIDWSPATAGRLLSGIAILEISTILKQLHAFSFRHSQRVYLYFYFHCLGDCKSMIHLWEPASGSWTVDPIPFAGHTASVEDLQVKPLLCS